MSYDPVQILKDHKLRKTKFRIAVLDAFIQSDNAMAQSDLEERIEGETDRITLYRTIKTFEQKGIVHKAIDGSAVPKFALCTEECSEHAHQDEHAHFHCLDCGQTICLEHVAVPKIKIPNGMIVEDAHLVLKGRCKNCNK